MIIKELFKKVSYEDLWKEFIKMKQPSHKRYPYDKYRHKAVFDFIKYYDNKKSNFNMIIYIKECTTIETDIKNCKKFLTVYGFNSDEISPSKISEMTNEDLLKVDIYALEYFDIYEWANWEVFQKSIETYGEIICAAHILYEMTFFGTNIKESRESLLDDLLDDMEYSKTPLVLCDKRI